MMPSNQFLDYLCSMGYAHRLDSVVTMPKPITSKHGGQGPGYRAQYVENPVGADNILMAMSLFGPGPRESGLDLAWALEYFRSLLTELKQNEAEYKAKEKEILSNTNDPAFFTKYMDNVNKPAEKAKENAGERMRDIESKAETNNAKSGNIDSTKKGTNAPMNPFITNKETIELDSITTLKMEITIYNEEDGYVSVNNKNGYYKKGDTIMIIKNVYVKGNYSYDGGSKTYLH